MPKLKVQKVKMDKKDPDKWFLTAYETLLELGMKKRDIEILLVREERSGIKNTIYLFEQIGHFLNSLQSKTAWAKSPSYNYSKGYSR